MRFNDRDYKLGDELVLKEYDSETYSFTGRILHIRIKYLLHGGQFGIQDGYVILGLEKL